ncbi:ABC transporter substrate-binding protein [Proteinivorax tanatarense]|uniref:ABC transporter substrate-binding protein n=1 Tax=Proteinivorax tanatarense TaxID=1260629 RepID=A0AAU7VPL2_9FIRM
MIKRVLAMVLTICVMLFGLVACGEAEDVKISESAEGELPTIKLAGGDWGYPSPFLHYPRGPGGFKMQMIFDSLLERGEDEIIPWLGKDWEISEDGKVITFVLEEEVYWHDGEKLDADDVKFSFDYFAEHSPVWNPVKIGGEPFIKEVKAVDENKVEFHLLEKNATALNVIGGVRIIPKHIWKDVEEPNSFESEKAVIGSGPYVLTDYSKEHETYEFTAFENFWGPKQKVERVQFVPVSDDVMAFENNDIDVITISSDLKERYEGKEEIEIVENPGFWGYRMVFNYERIPEFQDLEVRQAFAYGIDREEILERVGRGAGVVGSMGYLPVDHVMYNDNVKKYQYDPDKALKLLDDKNLELDLVIGDGTQEVRMAELIQLQLEKIGVDITVRSMDMKSRDDALRSGDYDILITGHGGWGSDPDSLRSRMVIDGYYNEEISELGQKQLIEIDPAKRENIVFELQELIAKDVPMIPIFQRRDYTVYRKDDYTGWMHMFDHHNMTHGKLSYLKWE